MISVLTNSARFLSSCGISTVQVDGFYLLETLTSAIERCSLAESYLDAQFAASLHNFPAGTLTSMSLSPSALLNNLKSHPTYKQVVRNSAIFADARKHVFNNAHNALLSHSIGNLPDWGPVQSTKINGTYSAAARVISGGPIRIASFDDPETDVQLVQQLIGCTAKGKTVALRPSGIGRATDPYVGFGDNVLLKIGNTHSKYLTALLLNTKDE